MRWVPGGAAQGGGGRRAIRPRGRSPLSLPGCSRRRARQRRWPPLTRARAPPWRASAASPRGSTCTRRHSRVAVSRSRGVLFQGRGPPDVRWHPAGTRQRSQPRGSLTLPAPRTAGGRAGSTRGCAAERWAAQHEQSRAESRRERVGAVWRGWPATPQTWAHPFLAALEQNIVELVGRRVGIILAADEISLARHMVALLLALPHPGCKEVRTGTRERASVRGT